MSDDIPVHLKQRFAEFLDSEHGNNQKNIQDLVHRRERRLAIDLTALRYFDPALANRLLREPGEYLIPLKEAVNDVIVAIDQKYLEQCEVHITFSGGFGFHRISPRELLSPFLGKVVNVEGIVTKCSCVRPKAAKTTHFCEATGRFITREYRDVASNAGLPTSTTYPTRDENGNVLTTEFGLCSYKDHQSFSMQELPELAPPGLLPRSIDVILEDDLIDQCKPGDRVSVVGIYKAMPISSSSSSSSGVFRTVLVALSLHQLSKDVAAPALSHEDIKNINELPRKLEPAALLALLGNSFAPSICGHHNIKRALILLLLGGSERNLKNGTHIRGDVNCLMVGDPSVAKSQLLRCVLGVAAYAVSATGRGSSGVGLTAAVTTDQESGERKLEAGAMVLADRGVVCIDEFDKMNDADRVAIHEVMEQQTVTISKAGIHASLNARCSVVAAANPVYGNYDHSQGVTRNINLPDSLLSRFDMLFIVLDQSDTKVDRAISSHVLAMHSSDNQQFSTTTILQKDMATLQSSDVDDTMYNCKVSGSEVLSKRFLQKFLYYAKHRPWIPKLMPDAEEFIAEHYSQWRVNKVGDTRSRRTLPITARTLETMIRLSTAHAKMRLSKTIGIVDASAAVDIMRLVVEADGLASTTSPDLKSRSNFVKKEADEKCSVEQLSKCPSDISTVKFAAFIKLFPSLFFHRESLTVDEIHLAATAWEGTENLSREELEVILNHMQATNKLLKHAGIVHMT